MSEAGSAEVVVVGAGLAGLVCAWKLERAGIDVVCLEASERVGGALRTHRKEGFVVEAGATTVNETPELARLIDDLDLRQSVVRTSASLARFVYRGGVLHRVPQSLPAAVTTGLVSPAGKLRALGEMAIRGVATEEESVAAFVTRRFGSEALVALVAPLVSGTFAGDPAKLSIDAVFPRLVALERASGSVLRGMLAGGAGDAERRTSGSLVSFREGLESLAEEIARRLGDRVRRASRVTEISAGEDGWRIVFAKADGAQAVSASSVVLAVPAWTASALLASVAPSASAALAEIEAPRLACVSLAWPVGQVAHPLDGFGFLVAPGEDVRILGCLWPSSMFEGRAPAGVALLTSFVGGARDPAGAALDDRALVDAVGADLSKILGARGEPRVVAIERYERAIPQYTIGHRSRVERIRAAMTSSLRLCGNYFEGVAVGESVRQGSAAAEAVENQRKAAVDFSRRGV